MAQLFWFLQTTGSVYNAPHTFFEGVRELPGGHYLLVENGKVGEAVRWWDVDIERARATYDYDDIDGEFLRLLRDCGASAAAQRRSGWDVLKRRAGFEHDCRAGNRRA